MMQILKELEISMKEHYIEYLKDFSGKSEIFFEGLYDYGTFRKEEFHKYTRTVYELNKLELSDTERCRLANYIWEISYRIQSHLSNHLDPIDVAFIQNLEEDEVRQISEILYYTAKWFTNNQEMNDKSIIIGGSWA